MNSEDIEAIRTLALQYDERDDGSDDYSVAFCDQEGGKVALYMVYYKGTRYLVERYQHKVFSLVSVE